MDKVITYWARLKVNVISLNFFHPPIPHSGFMPNIFGISKWGLCQYRNLEISMMVIYWSTIVSVMGIYFTVDKNLSFTLLLHFVFYLQFTRLTVLVKFWNIFTILNLLTIFIAWFPTGLFPLNNELQKYYMVLKRQTTVISYLQH